MEKEREHHVYLARLAEQAERYDGSVSVFFFLCVFNLFGAWQINLHMFIDLWISSYNYSDYVSFCALISCLIHAIDELHQVLLLCWCQLLVTFSVICFTL